jgi:hypothetical protein
MDQITSPLLLDYTDRDFDPFATFDKKGGGPGRYGKPLSQTARAGGARPGAKG